MTGFPCRFLVCLLHPSAVAARWHHQQGFLHRSHLTSSDCLREFLLLANANKGME